MQRIVAGQKGYDVATVKFGEVVAEVHDGVVDTVGVGALFVEYVVLAFGRLASLQEVQPRLDVCANRVHAFCAGVVLDGPRARADDILDGFERVER